VSHNRSISPRGARLGEEIEKKRVEVKVQRRKRK